jgi:hypothetical protein
LLAVKKKKLLLPPHPLLHRPRLLLPLLTLPLRPLLLLLQPPPLLSRPRSNSSPFSRKATFTGGFFYG